MQARETSPMGELYRELEQAMAVSRGVADRLLSRQGHTLARWKMLDVIASEPKSVPAVARRLSLTRQSTQRVADILVEEGFLTRLPNPDHRRSPLYACTEAGFDAVHRLPQTVSDWYESLNAEFTADELVEFTGLVRRLRVAAEAFAGARDGAVAEQG